MTLHYTEQNNKISIKFMYKVGVQDVNNELIIWIIWQDDNIIKSRQWSA